MRVLTDPAAVRHTVAHARDRGPVAFVPTMGALHAGHAALLRRARADCPSVLASIFVNPTQFGPGEDYHRYPRTPEEDSGVAREAGVDLLWFPREQDLYPPGEVTRVTVGSLGKRLCGASRPGHFDGVATVVVKLLVAAMPTVLYLGEKDYQQTVVLRRVIEDLGLPVTVRVVPTVRDPDGLALSSRNAYLSAAERASALAIPQALSTVVERVHQGDHHGAHLLATMRGVLAASPEVQVEYVALVHPDTLEPITDLDEPARACIAARVGRTRLIDNALLIPPGA